VTWLRDYEADGTPLLTPPRCAPGVVGGFRLAPASAAKGDCQTLGHESVPWIYLIQNDELFRRCNFLKSS
jgi:hypothetical protein